MTPSTALLLDGIVAKLQRADEHIRYLDAEINQFAVSDSCPYRIESGFDDDPLKYIFKGYSATPVPLRYSVIAGEAVHQLRSCFDHLVRVLVVAQNNTPTRSHQFPVARRREAFVGACDRGQVKGISKSAFKRIIRLQPYRMATPKASTLVAIHDLDIRDKHRLLFVVGGAAKIGSKVRIGKPFETTSMPSRTTVDFGTRGNHILTKEGVKVFSVTIDAPKPDFTADTDFAFNVCLSDFGTGEVVPLVPTLTKMWEFTRSAIETFSDEW